MDFAAVLAAILALGALVTKTVDLLRNLLDPNDTFPKVTWNILALAVGVAYCLGWQVSLGPAVISLIPSLAQHAERLNGVAGQIFTGLLAGGAAGFLHELFDNLSSGAKMKKRNVGYSSAADK